MKTLKQIVSETVYTDKKAREHYLFGHCRSFAHALHKKIGGEVRALHKDGRELHVYVHKDGKNYDVNGKQNHAQMVLNIEGSLDNFQRYKEHPVDHEKMKINNNMVDNAEKYIDHNKRKFNIK